MAYETVYHVTPIVQERRRRQRVVNNESELSQSARHFEGLGAISVNLQHSPPVHTVVNVVPPISPPPPLTPPPPSPDVRRRPPLGPRQSISNRYVNEKLLQRDIETEYVIHSRRRPSASHGYSLPPLLVPTPSLFSSFDSPASGFSSRPATPRGSIVSGNFPSRLGTPRGSIVSGITPLSRSGTPRGSIAGVTPSSRIGTPRGSIVSGVTPAYHRQSVSFSSDYQPPYAPARTNPTVNSFYDPDPVIISTTYPPPPLPRNDFQSDKLSASRRSSYSRPTPVSHSRMDNGMFDCEQYTVHAPVYSRVQPHLHKVEQPRSCKPESYESLRARTQHAKEQIKHHQQLMDRYLPVNMGPVSDVRYDVEYKFVELADRFQNVNVYVIKTYQETTISVVAVGVRVQMPEFAAYRSPSRRCSVASMRSNNPSRSGSIDHGSIVHQTPPSTPNLSEARRKIRDVLRTSRTK